MHCKIGGRGTGWAKSGQPLWVSTRITLAVALLPFHIAFFVAGGPPFWRHWRGLLVAMACLTLPYLPLALWQVPTLLSPFETGHPFFSLDVML